MPLTCSSPKAIRSTSSCTAASDTTWAIREDSAELRLTSHSSTRTTGPSLGSGCGNASTTLERGSTMRSVDEQLARVIAAAVRPAPVRVAISEAQGLLCAEEVVAERALPGFDQAAVDGYAVRSVDVQPANDSPVSLPVVGEIPAGSRQPRRLQPGQAVRVATGAPLPTLADAVVPVGFADGGSARLMVHCGVPSAAFVRRIGEDVQPGDVAVRRDAVIGAAQVA